MIRPELRDGARPRFPEFDAAVSRGSIGALYWRRPCAGRAAASGMRNLCVVLRPAEPKPVSRMTAGSPEGGAMRRKKGEGPLSSRKRLQLR